MEVLLSTGCTGNRDGHGHRRTLHPRSNSENENVLPLVTLDASSYQSRPAGSDCRFCNCGSLCGRYRANGAFFGGFCAPDNQAHTGTKQQKTRQFNPPAFGQGAALRKLFRRRITGFLKAWNGVNVDTRL